MTFSLPNAYEPPPEAQMPSRGAITTTWHLTQARHLAGISQRALADLLGTTETTVSRLERGTTPIDTRWSSHLTLLFAHIIPIARAMEEDQ
jgi:DNA-binding XRE family transcriptional regulator